MNIEANNIYNVDCLKGMKSIENESVDLIITDPPYNIEYKSNHRQKNEFNGDTHDWDKDFDINPYFKEMWRVLRPGGVIYMFGRWDTIQDLRIRKPNGCLIWDKTDHGMGDLTFWSMSYEFIYIFKKSMRHYIVYAMTKSSI